MFRIILKCPENALRIKYTKEKVSISKYPLHKSNMILDIFFVIEQLYKFNSFNPLNHLPKIIRVF